MLLKRRDTLIDAGVFLALMAALAAFYIDQHPDRAYITYRYAHNLATGRGLVYNFGQTPFLSGAVSAPYAALLGIAGLLVDDIPTLANIIGMLAIAAAGILMARLASPAGRWPSLLAGCFILVSPMLWPVVGQETPLWLALCLAGLWLHLGKAGTGAAICLGLATLIRADAAVLAALLAGHSFYTRRPLVLLPGGVYAGIAGLGSMIFMAFFQGGGVQSPYLASALAGFLPEALGENLFAGLAGLAGALAGLSILWLLALILCLVGLARIRNHAWMILLAVWAILQLVILGVSGSGILLRDLAPLAAVLAGLLALSAELILAYVPEDRMRWGALGAIAVISVGTGLYSSLAIPLTPPAESQNWRVLAAGTADPRINAAAEWLNQNAPPEAIVAATRSGRLGYQVTQPLLDYYGALQPDIGKAAARGDTSWWLTAYSPAYLVIDSNEMVSGGGSVLAPDEWFGANYVQVAGFTKSDISTLIFQRTTPVLPVNPTLIGFTNYPDGLTVNGIASDFSLFPLETGRTGLIRLEWLVNYPVTVPQVVTIRIQGRGGGAIAALATRTIDFSRWPTRQLITTFHPITLVANLPSGVYDISVGIGPDANLQQFKDVAVAKVPFQGSTDLGGISGTRAEFGDISLLGYRVGLRPEGLEVFLLWQANRVIAANYHIIIQIHDANGAVVAGQDMEPHNGAYPTSVWSPNEQVTDTILLGIGQIPPGEYDVFVGLTTPDGKFVRTADQKDAVFVGHITLAAP